MKNLAFGMGENLNDRNSSGAMRPNVPSGGIHLPGVSPLEHNAMDALRKAKACAQDQAFVT